MTLVSSQLIALTEKLRDQVDKLRFASPVEWVYNPLRYAWAPHCEYLSRYSNASCEVLLLGMNPGPFGMAQTGVPFGEIAAVRDWMGINIAVEKPKREHPKRPIEGFDCTKSEVSGRRLWGLFAARYGSAESFFQKHFVVNYCPLVFMDAGAKNITPDKLPKEESDTLEKCCDDYLLSIIRVLAPRHVVGVGGYAESCLKRVLQNEDSISIARILHPSPASPAANRDWSGQATKQLEAAGIW